MAKIILTKNKKFKNLLTRQIKKGGRNNTGKITVFHQGGGNKIKYKLIDFTKFIWNSVGILKNIEYDPNRTSLLSLIIYTQGIICYTLKIEKTYIGDKIRTENRPIKFSGWSSYLKNFELNSIISQIEYYYLSINQYCRASGNYGIILKYTQKKFIWIKLKSRKIKIFKKWNLATLGKIENIKINNKKNYRNAGHKRNRGIRPTTRGVAMNPIDHPHGGGEGKTSGGRPSASPWGKITKGLKTRKKWKKKLINA